MRADLERKPAPYAVVFAVLASLWGVEAAKAPYPWVAWDFPAFFLAGRVPIPDIYNQDVVRRYGVEQLSPLGVKYYPPFVRPAIFAIPLHAFRWVSFWHAFYVWAALQFVAYCCAVFLLFRQYHFHPMLLAAFGLFYPFFGGTLSGQDIGMTCLVAVGFLSCLRMGRDRAAGLILPLALAKFHLFLFVPVLLIARKKRSTLLWGLIGCVVTIAACLFVTPLESYLALLNNPWRFTIGSSLSTLVSLRGMASLLGHPALYYPAATIVALTSIFVIWVSDIPKGTSIAILAALLCAPYVSWYDCALLLIPAATLFVSERAFTKPLCMILVAFPFFWRYPPRVWVSLSILALWGDLAWNASVDVRQVAAGRRRHAEGEHASAGR
jgi:glycosyl transferase family 87